MQIRHIIKLLNQFKPNLAWMVLMWPPLQIVSDSLDLPSRWLLLLNIDCCFIINQNEYKFNIEMSTLNIYSGFFVNFFIHLIYTTYANWKYFDKRSDLNLLLWNHWTTSHQIWLGRALSGPFFKIMSDSSTLHSRWWPLLKTEFFIIVYGCLITSQNEL
jgi:hypothetical protein